jgi:hypothetical protein
MVGEDIKITREASRVKSNNEKDGTINVYKKKKRRKPDITNKEKTEDVLKEPTETNEETQDDNAVKTIQNVVHSISKTAE